MLYGLWNMNMVSLRIVLFAICHKFVADLGELLFTHILWS